MGKPNPPSSVILLWGLPLSEVGRDHKDGLFCGAFMLLEKLARNSGMVSTLVSYRQQVNDNTHLLAWVFVALCFLQLAVYLC